MHCPRCSHYDTKVTDTRACNNGFAIRRRRQCLECNYRFSTVEESLTDDLVVIKRDGRREPFERAKLRSGIIKATEKRPIQIERIDTLISDITKNIQRDFDQEIKSKAIGALVMDSLKAIDQIAYVRFASVYKDFRDISELAQEIDRLQNV
jgi:transcriptional repressor NrdR